MIYTGRQKTTQKTNPLLLSRRHIKQNKMEKVHRTHGPMKTTQITRRPISLGALSLWPEYERKANLDEKWINPESQRDQISNEKSIDRWRSSHTKPTHKEKVPPDQQPATKKRTQLSSFPRARLPCFNYKS